MCNVRFKCVLLNSKELVDTVHDWGLLGARTELANAPGERGEGRERWEVGKCGRREGSQGKLEFGGLWQTGNWCVLETLLWESGCKSQCLLLDIRGLSECSKVHFIVWVSPGIYSVFTLKCVVPIQWLHNLSYQCTRYLVTELVVSEVSFSFARLAFWGVLVYCPSQESYISGPKAEW